MRIVLADIKGGDRFIRKDTVAGGYGSRLRPLSKVTPIVAALDARVERRHARCDGMHMTGSATA